MRNRLPSVSVVVPVYNSESTISACLRRVTMLNYPRGKREVIVVDDGSTDRTLEIVQGYPVKLIRKEHNGYPSAMNAGIKASSGDFVVIVDSDTYVDEEFLIKVIEEFKDPEVGIVGGYVATAPTSSFWAKLVGFESEDRYDRIKSKYVDYLTSTCTAYRIRFLDKVGLFNEALRRNSDEDLAHRAFKAGWKIVLRKDALCYHEWRSSLKRYFLKQASNAVYEVSILTLHPSLLLGKRVHPPSLYVPLILMLLLALTPLWLFIGGAWISLLALFGLILWHIPQGIRIIRKNRDWTMLFFPLAINVRYAAWLVGLAIGTVKEVTRR